MSGSTRRQRSRRGSPGGSLPDDEVASQTEAAALHLASLDPRSVQATKRLMNAGRAEVSRTAMVRELSEFTALLPRT